MLAQVCFQKPKDMYEMFMPVQTGYRVMAVTLSEAMSRGIHLLQLHFILDSVLDPDNIISMPPKTVHKFIRI